MFKLCIFILSVYSANAGIISTGYGLGGFGGYDDHGVAVAAPVASIASPLAVAHAPVAAVASPLAVAHAPVAVASHGAVSYQNYNQLSVNPVPVVGKVAAAVAQPVVTKVATVGVAPVGVAAPIGVGLGYGGLSIGHGVGYANGYGLGYGNSYGLGYGNGYGLGYGNGYGLGYGNGYGVGKVGLGGYQSVVYH